MSTIGSESFASEWKQSAFVRPTSGGNGITYINILHLSDRLFEPHGDFAYSDSKEHPWILITAHRGTGAFMPGRLPLADRVPLVKNPTGSRIG